MNFQLRIIHEIVRQKFARASNPKLAMQDLIIEPAADPSLPLAICPGTDTYQNYMSSPRNPPL